MGQITIATILDRPDLAAFAAGWHWAQWGRKNGATLAGELAWIGSLTSPAGPPQCFVLLDGVTPAAMATLVHHDLEARPDLSPWLADLIVAPAHRGRGHAIRLVRHVEEASRAAGIPELYLNTESAAALYARLGWQEIGAAGHKGHPVTIMRRNL